MRLLWDWKPDSTVRSWVVLRGWMLYGLCLLKCHQRDSRWWRRWTRWTYGIVSWQMIFIAGDHNYSDCVSRDNKCIVYATLGLHAQPSGDRYRQPSDLKTQTWVQIAFARRGTHRASWSMKAVATGEACRILTCEPVHGRPVPSIGLVVVPHSTTRLRHMLNYPSYNRGTYVIIYCIRDVWQQY